MSYKIDPPRTFSSDPTVQVQQLQTYLYNLSEQLNYALNYISTSVEGIGFGSIVAGGSRVIATSGGKLSDEDATDLFESIKGLIIKSSDIVNSYSEKITEVFNSIYTASGDYGGYTQEERMQLEKSSGGIIELFENIQKIVEDGTETYRREASAHINIGKLGEDSNGYPVYGIEIGEKVVDGDDVRFDTLARFVPDRLSFFDQSGNEIAYFAGRKLYITELEVGNSIRMGGYKVDLSNGIEFKWEG